MSSNKNKKALQKTLIVVAIGTVLSVALIGLFLSGIITLGPSKARFLSFQQGAITQTSREDGYQEVEEMLQAFLSNTGYTPIATSTVNACYQVPVTEYFFVKEHRKHCYVRKMIAVSIQDEWKSVGKRVDDMGAAHSWSWDNNSKYETNDNGICYYHQNFRFDKTHPLSSSDSTVMDLYVGPLEPNDRGSNGVCYQGVVSQERGLSTIKSDNRPQHMHFYEKSLFDENVVQTKVNEGVYKNVLRAGFTSEYFDEKIE